MARSRSTARLTSAAFYDAARGDGEDLFTPSLRAVLDLGDPSLPQITRHVLVARLAGRDVTDPAVIDECIAAGRVDHALTLGGAA